MRCFAFSDVLRFHCFLFVVFAFFVCFLHVFICRLCIFPASSSVWGARSSGRFRKPGNAKKSSAFCMFLVLVLHFFFGPLVPPEARRGSGKARHAKTWGIVHFLCVVRISCSLRVFVCIFFAPGRLLRRCTAAEQVFCGIVGLFQKHRQPQHAKPTQTGTQQKCKTNIQNAKYMFKDFKSVAKQNSSKNCETQLVVKGMPSIVWNHTLCTLTFF